MLSLSAERNVRERVDICWHHMDAGKSHGNIRKSPQTSGQGRESWRRRGARRATTAVSAATAPRPAARHQASHGTPASTPCTPHQRAGHCQALRQRPGVGARSECRLGWIRAAPASTTSALAPHSLQAPPRSPLSLPPQQNRGGGTGAPPHARADVALPTELPLICGRHSDVITSRY